MQRSSSFLIHFRTSHFSAIQTTRDLNLYTFGAHSHGCLIAGGYSENTPAAIVYKATWEDEKAVICTVGTLAKAAEENNITKTALMIIGDAVTHSHYERSELYNPAFTTEFRQATKER